ncbi:ligand-binding sensor domain-containing protein [Romboutsia sp. Marseille-P6047]|uniref:ligand-binding sensor domain-containing protein n=1 Tax=Romboutsia sp. Marseille-P6047 TaxID=2161817 RepID=UPI000F04AF87|nr:ATP-binding protein [Romboutsia sp. Marseille-P6047]
MNRDKIITFMTLLLICICLPAIAHASEFMFYNLTTSDGLSQASINSIYQDSSDYIWIGTKNGLNRYNGFKFEIYNKGFSEKRNIIDSYITCLNEDLNNNLWVGTHDGLSKINLKTEKITNYTVTNSSLSSNKIMDIKINNQGDIIIATSNGLNIYDHTKDNFISLVKQDFKLSYSKILSIEFYNDNEIYMISKNHLLKYDMINNEYSIIKSLTEDAIFTTLSLYKDAIYLGTEYDGLYVYNISTKEIDNKYKLYINDDSGNSHTINHIYNDNTGIYVGSTNGLYIYKENDFPKHFTNNSYDEYSLINNNISYIMKDSSGLLWIGTFCGISTVDCTLGISYYDNFVVDPDVKNNIIVGTYEDVNENLWLGVYGNGISILDKKNNTIKQLNTKTDNKLNSDTIWDIKGNEKYVFATSSVGLNIINRETLKVQSLLDNKFCHTLYVDGDYLWVGTIGGFDIVDLNDFSVKSINKLLTENNININLGGPIFKDSQSIYWLGGASKEGLIQFDPNNNSVNLFKYNEFENSISDNTILSITEDSKGNLWFGTESALNKYNRLTKEFKSYSIEDGLSNNTIYSIIPFNDKILISTNSGINCLEFKNDELTTVKKYLNKVEFSINSFLKTKNGEYILGSISGIYVIDPNIIESNTTSPVLHFDNVSINGVDINDSNNISMDYKENFITMSLFTNIYNNVQNIDFYYRINNDKWTLMHDNEVTPSNLADKKYTIDFIAQNFNGNHSEIESISFYVNPPFWRSKFAKFIYFLLFFIIIIYVSFKIVHLKNAITLKNKQLAKEINEKNEILQKNIELEKRKNNYLINMSHELRTPLNVIGATQQLIVNLNKTGSISSNELSRYMKINDNNLKRLLNIINDLIDSSKMNEGIYNLLLEENDIIYVVEEAALSLKSLAEEKEIDLIVDTNIEDCIMKFDQDAIERCIINIVGNAIKFTDSYGKILVNIVDSKDILTIEISDNGSGIPPEKIDSIFDRFSQVVSSKREFSKGSGLGLTITKGLIELHGGDITVTSELGKGSTFTIILPKKI